MFNKLWNYFNRSLTLSEVGTILKESKGGVLIGEVLRSLNACFLSEAVDDKFELIWSRE